MRKTTIDYLTDSNALRERQGETEIRIKLELIDPNPFQPRTDFDHVEEMAQSLLDQGQDYPILVRKVGDRYQVADGETRLRAARLNRDRHPEHEKALPTLLAVVRPYTDEDMALIAFRTAYQRKSLNPIEEARGLKRMMESFRLSLAEVGKKIGKTKDYVDNRVRLLNMPDYLIKLLEDDTENLTPAHARVLAGIPDASILERLTNIVLETGLSKNELQRRKKLIDTILEAAPLTEAQRSSLIEEAFTGKLSEEGLASSLSRVSLEASPEQPQAPRTPAPWATFKTPWKQLPPEKQEELNRLVQEWFERNA